MSTDTEIGRVVAVDTSQLTIELTRELKALTRSTYEGTAEVGRINSYVVIPVGARRIVGMITRVVMMEESELRADATMVALPSTRRLMKATMIGTIDEDRFRQGVSLFPVLDSKVLLTSKRDLDAIFGTGRAAQNPDPEEPGYCIRVGSATVAQDYDVFIDPDAFFGKHAAVIGSTGSGKSCSIASVLQAVLQHPSVRRTRIIILDTNGEYAAAFGKPRRSERDDGRGGPFDCLNIPTDPGAPGHLTIPYWFMNADDFTRLFRAAPGVQRPILLSALTMAREEARGPGWAHLREQLIQEIHRIFELLATGTWQDRANMTVLCRGVQETLQAPQQAQPLRELVEQYPGLEEAPPADAFETALREAGRANNRDYDPLALPKKQRAQDALNNLLAVLAQTPTEGLEASASSADRPSYFDKGAFRFRHLESAMSRDQSRSARVRENCGTMMMRIHRLLEDVRYDFLFGPPDGEWPKVKHSLATFLRDIIGLRSAGADLSSDELCPPGVLPYYDRQRANPDPSNVVVVDLSLLAAEVLENVTALIGRLVHEFLQRLSDPRSGVERGGLPIVLVLEEAQNYIREDAREADESISKQVFERIAREGRKFGLGLVVASQRPSELSKTVLSQCNSFIVHRLQNPEDLRYFRQIVPGVYNQLLDQLPALAPRSALVLGECVNAPVLVEMREADPVPRSKNPKFFRSWAREIREPDVEAICAVWEGVEESTNPPEAAPEKVTDQA